MGVEVINVPGDATNVFNRKAPSKGQEWVTIGVDGRFKKDIFERTLNLNWHYDTDVGKQLRRVYVVNGLAIDVFSLHIE